MGYWCFSATKAALSEGRPMITTVLLKPVLNNDPTNLSSTFNPYPVAYPITVTVCLIVTLSLYISTTCFSEH